MAEIFKYRQYYILTFFAVAGLLLAARAFQLQVVDDTYRIQAQAVAMNKQTLYPARGLIFDRNEKLLINNAPVYDLMVTYNQIREGMDTTKFCDLLGITETSFKERLNKDFRNDMRYSKITPFVFMSTISPEMYARFQESMYEFPGFFVQIRNIRNYPVNAAAHVLGYITEVTQEDIDNSEGQYKLRDYIGASGLEKWYEKELRGEKGVAFVLKDNMGRDIGKFNNGDDDEFPESGLDLITTLDIDLQEYVEELMQNKVGGVVAIEPKTGEILAFASAPSYDPALMVIGGDRGRAFSKLQQDSLKPLFNRAIMAEYPPGSIFKPVVGLIGMQEAVIQPETGMPCPGYYQVSSRDVRKCRGHAYPGNVGTALQWSCNSYFFQTFRQIIDKHGYYEPQLGLTDFLGHLNRMGLGRKLGVDFPGEKSGNAPSVADYDRTYPKNLGGWKSPTIISLGIGQGEMQLTTLQMANLAAIIANDGHYYTPHFLKSFKHKDSVSQKPMQYRQRFNTQIAPYLYTSIQEGMQKVVTAGTARSAWISDVSVAGKTGTVQNPFGEDHSTFIAFAPVENPKIAIAVYVENAGGGGRHAAPIASLAIEKYMKGEISPQRKWLEQRTLETDLAKEKLP